MRAASAFTGIGGFDLAFENEGVEITVQIEVNKHRQQVLREHFNAPLIERIEDATGSDLGRPDLFASRGEPSVPADTLTFEIVSPEVGLPYCVSTVDGLRIGWDMCGSCGQHIINCIHDVPVEPSYVRKAPGMPVSDDYRYRPADEVLDPIILGRGALRRSQESKPFNVMSLVDQDMVDQIKTASKERADAPDNE